MEGQKSFWLAFANKKNNFFGKKLANKAMSLTKVMLPILNTQMVSSSETKQNSA